MIRLPRWWRIRKFRAKVRAHKAAKRENLLANFRTMTFDEPEVVKKARLQ